VPPLLPLPLLYHYTTTTTIYSESTINTALIVAHGPLLVYDSTLGPGTGGIPTDMPSLHAKWSKHYRDKPQRATGHIIANPTGGGECDAADWADEDLAEAEAESAANDLAPWVLEFYHRRLAVLDV
jgi:hypothetical protein